MMVNLGPNFNPYFLNLLGFGQVCHNPMQTQVIQPLIDAELSAGFQFAT